MPDRLRGSNAATPEVDAREAHRRVQEENALLLDVREADELRDAAVPGALHIPLGDLTRKGNTLPRDRDLLLLCQSGSRSALATEMLHTNGFQRAWNVTGGIIAWRKARLPVE